MPGRFQNHRAEQPTHPVLTALSILLTALLAVGLARAPRKSATEGRRVASLPLGAQVQQELTNRLSGVLDGVASVEKVYWLRDDEPAPLPNPACYGQSDDPATLASVVQKAAPLLDGQSLYFKPDTELMPGTKVFYYLDETILALNWKAVIDNGVYTFSEVKLAHPSQLRRFLADSTYGSNNFYLTSEMAKSVNAVLAVSGDYYAYRYQGILICDGVVRLNNNGVDDMCYIDRDGNLLLRRGLRFADQQEAQRFAEENDIRFSLAFGPILVHEGQLSLPAWYPFGQPEGVYPRAALCQMDTLHYLHAAANGQSRYPSMPSVYQFGRRIAETGCKEAYTLDGGQTATVVMDNQVVNYVNYGSERKISDILYFATALPQETPD